MSDLHKLALEIGDELTRAQGKLAELVRQAALLEPKAVVRCTVCDYRPAQNMPSLAEHAHTAHGAPPPAHWVAS